mgnify:CR=1 FL=1
MNILPLSGLEELQNIVSGKMPQPAMVLTMGGKIITAEPGFARIEAVANETHLNPMLGVHGGFACTILDSITGCAVHSLLKVGESYGTIDISVKMMRPVPQGTRLIAEGRMINMSKSLGVSEGKLVDEAGKIYAHATCTCKINRPAS